MRIFATPCKKRSVGDFVACHMHQWKTLHRISAQSSTVYSSSHCLALSKFLHRGPAHATNTHQLAPTPAVQGELHPSKNRTWINHSTRWDLVRWSYDIASAEHTARSNYMDLNTVSADSHSAIVLSVRGQRNKLLNIIAVFYTYQFSPNLSWRYAANN